MATQEKLLKSLETLKSIASDKSKEKEKLQCCAFITEAISNPTIKIAPIFETLLNFTVELFVQLCDDPASDVRMFADECLNRMIRGSKENIGRIQIELFKVIWKNGPARSLRAAFSKFAQLAHLIKQYKCKVYVTNLTPRIIKITERDEDILHEMLAIHMPKIMAVIGSFFADTEIKLLLKAFLDLMPTTSAAKRRSMAICVLTICLNCRKPLVFVSYVLKVCIDYLVPIHENQSTSLILSVFGCLKAVLPQIKQSNDKLVVKFDTTLISIDRLLQIYELCLHYSSHSDHNIVNATLETLNVLLVNCPIELDNVLLSENGILESKIYTNNETPKLHPRSPSQTSVATTNFLEDETLDIDSALADSLKSDIERWIDDSKLNVIDLEKDTVHFSNSSSFEDIETEFASNIRIGVISDNVDGHKSESYIDNLDKLTLSDNLSEKSASCYGDSSLLDSILYYDSNIGEFCDRDIPLKYCVRHITKSFLLTGYSNNLIPDKIVRVSVKSLALGCLSSIFAKYPQGLLLYLDKNEMKDVESAKQQISDILLYEKHTDPQLRGAVRLLVASFIKATLLRTEKNYFSYIENNSNVPNIELFNINWLLTILKSGLEDDSSTCTRQSLIALSICLKNIINSSDYTSIDFILKILPGLAKNPYWLVKVKLLEIISEIDFISIQFITGNSTFQNHVLHNVLFELLKDDDQRVRNAASNSICKIIPFLYFNNEHSKESIIIHKAILQRNQCFDDNKQLLSNDTSFSFNKISNATYEDEEKAISKIISTLQQHFLTTTSKHHTLGLVETLSMLSIKYPPTVYSLSWACFQSFNVNYGKNICLDIDVCSSQDLLSICISMLTQNIICYDFNLHLNLLKLTGNLYSGKCIKNLEVIEEVNLEDCKVLWNFFTEKQLGELSEQFLVHVLRMLNIFLHVLDEIVPVTSQLKTVLPNLPHPSTLSPIKRRKSDLGEKIKLVKSTEKEENKDKKGENLKPNTLGHFLNSPYYMKMYELIRISYNNYKITLDDTASENFLGLLKVTLSCLSQILEIGTIVEFGRVAEEILTYLKSTFYLDPYSTVECVQQLLKSLFGNNLSSNISKISSVDPINNQQNEESFGFYYNIFQKPYSDISTCIKDLSNNDKIDIDNDSIVMGYLHRREVKNLIVKNSKDVLASYIKIFEPMVIKSLKQYTMTSNVKLQCKVLHLLCQLVELHVNYCLLDSEQNFIRFVLRQFEFIEEGQIVNSEELIPNIFKFLLYLSYGKHSKSIIGVPKILQLCDGLIASGQHPLSHCIPALKPVVTDIFLKRNKSNTSDIKELETTREVLLSMLLKLAEHAEIIELLVLILNESKYCGDKWIKWSKQIMDVILPMLKQNKIEIDDWKAFTAIKNLVYVMNPYLFQQPNDYITMFFRDFYLLEQDAHINFNRWLGKQIILLIVLLQLKEETLLMKIAELKADFDLNSIFYNVNITPDPLNVTASFNFFQNIEPEIIFARLLFKTVHMASKKVLIGIKNEEDNFVVEQLNIFLMCCTYIFQAGLHSKTTKTILDLLNDKTQLDSNHIYLDEINNTFLKFANWYPILTCQWSNLLFIMNYNAQEFWKIVLEDRKINNSLNFEITKMGCCITYCDYLSEHSNCEDEYNFLLKNHVDYIVNISEEVPVLEFINSLHRNSESSKIFLDNLYIKTYTFTLPSLKMKILNCLENTHSSQIGLLLEFLTSKLLCINEFSILRLVVKLISSKLAYLFTLNEDEVKNKLPVDSLHKIIKNFKSINNSNCCETSIGLLNKLSVQYYNLPPIENDQRKAIDCEEIKNLSVDKNWYLTQVKIKCISSNIKGEECAELLSKLEYEDIINVMSTDGFKKVIVKYCFKWCLQKEKNECNLFKASEKITLQDLNNLIQYLPTIHQVYLVEDRSSNSEELEYIENLNKVFTMENYWEILKNLASSLQIYINISSNKKEFQEFILKFAVLSLESVNYQITVHKKINIHLFDLLLTCSKSIFKHSDLCSVLGETKNINLLSSGINSLYKIVNYLLLDKEQVILVKNDVLKETLGDPKTISAGFACYQLSCLVLWLEKCQKTEIAISKSNYESVKSMIVSFSRLPAMNSFILTPNSAFKNGWQPVLFGDFKTEVPPLPIQFMQEVEILEEFIFRKNLLGWTNRQQFEETWMCLLSVLNPSPEEFNSEDITHTTSLAIQAITSLLIETLSEPIPGNKNISTIIHVPRDLIIHENTASIKKLKNIQHLFENIYLNITQTDTKNSFLNVFEKPNLEKIQTVYSYSQVSLEYLSISAKIVDIVDENCLAAQTYRKRQKILQDFNLDVNSCIQFLLELYSQWLKSPQTQLRILQEVVRSMVLISDLFTEKSQFSWMLESFLEIYKNHTTEDEVLHQYFVIGICKSVALLLPQNLETLENVKKILMQSLKSAFLPARISSLHGILFILQGCVLTNTIIGGISEEIKLFLPVAVEYIQYNSQAIPSVLSQSQEHNLLLWALSFYIIENIDVPHIEATFVSTIVQNAIANANRMKSNAKYYNAIVKGLERLIIKRRLPEKLNNQILTFSLTNMKNLNQIIALPSIQLLLTCMYTECAVQLQNTVERNGEVQSNPDNLVQTLEKVSAIFDKIKKGYIIEVKLLCAVLPTILNDFFPPSDILTKVIGEFLSPQQRHPILLSKVVFQVFECAIKQSQLSLLQDWVVFSLPNFIQLSPIGMATWCLTCFFISATKNEWLRSLFPFVQSRIGRYEFEDRKMLCISGSDFYQNLTNDKQKQTFTDTFEKVKNQPDTPYQDLLSSL